MTALITDISRDPLGQALLDYYHGKADNKLIAHCDIADDDYIPIPHFFRSYEEMPKLEQLALQYCRGHILDIGAGAGSHSLALQIMGQKVTAIDISPGAVAVMRARGIKNVLHSDFYAWDRQKFDTLLLMMNGIGLVGNLKGLELFMLKAQSILAKGGQILLDSSDLSYLFIDETGTMRIDNGKPFWGEATFRMKYNNIRGEAFRWLYLDISVLENYAQKYGYTCELLYEGDQHDYLARLSLSK